jgi:hypothetical protein
MKKASARDKRPPSARSLQEMPEVDFSQARRNPYAERIAREGYNVNARRGRPRRGTETGRTTTKTIRFPDAVWELLAERADSEGMTLHAALRAAVLAWAKHAGREVLRR